MRSLYPLKFKPVYKDYLWGNARLPELYNRKPHEGICAESWEISAHPDGMSIVENGHLAGLSLSEVIKEFGSGLMGTRVKGDTFPLLIKLIDAAQPLSVQVHPNDGNAEAVRGEPKTEMWYFLGDDERAQVFCGFNEALSPEQFIQAIEDKSFKTILRTIPARQGEAVYVPGGRVHAIDAGCLILEIQQSSNTTYRVYDWDRVDADGNAREMHLEQALQVIKFDDDGHPLTQPVPFIENGTSGTEICKSDYFKLDRFELDDDLNVALDGSTFHALFVADGALRVIWPDGEQRIGAGTSLLIPADLGVYQLSVETKKATVLRTSIPA